jgi:hypothetical protein
VQVLATAVAADDAAAEASSVTSEESVSSGLCRLSAVYVTKTRSRLRESGEARIHVNAVWTKRLRGSLAAMHLVEGCPAAAAAGEAGDSYLQDVRPDGGQGGSPTHGADGPTAFIEPCGRALRWTDLFGGAGGCSFGVPVDELSEPLANNERVVFARGARWPRITAIELNYLDAFYSALAVPPFPLGGPGPYLPSRAFTRSMRAVVPLSSGARASARWYAASASS